MVTETSRAFTECNYAHTLSSQDMQRTQRVEIRPSSLRESTLAAVPRGHARPDYVGGDGGGVGGSTGST